MAHKLVLLVEYISDPYFPHVRIFLDNLTAVTSNHSSIPSFVLVGGFKQLVAPAVVNNELVFLPPYSVSIEVFILAVTVRGDAIRGIERKLRIDDLIVGNNRSTAPLVGDSKRNRVGTYACIFIRESVRR